MTVPDAGELDQLRTWGGVYRRGLYTTGSRDDAHLRELSPCLHLHVNPPQSRWTRMMLGEPVKKFIVELDNKLA